MSFYNPYHFVSVKKDKRINDFEVDKFQSSDFSTHKHLQQDRFTNEIKDHTDKLIKVNSGRIICRITTESPIVIGDYHDEKIEPTKVEQYFLDVKPAIPATSLRGLISSIVEAASNSSLRVLNNDDFYSYRKQMTQGLSAIGMIVLEGGKFKLRPLTLPTLTGKQGDSIKVADSYRKVFDKPNLKVYVDQNGTYKTYRNDEKKYYYLKLQNRDWEADGTLSFDGKQKWKVSDYGPHFLISQNFDSNILTQQDYDKITDKTEQDKYTRGILRVLACDERKKEMPKGKKHEVFIPYSEDIAKCKTLEIPQKVIDKFHALSDQMTESVKKKTLNEIKKAKNSDEIESIKRTLLPYEPIYTVRNANPTNKDDFTFRLKEGDLVYFSLDEKSQIIEIALSSIWRDRKEIESNGTVHGVTAHDFFNIVDSELLSFNSKRKQITFAEQMFGFVEQVTDKNKKSGLALAGRISFSAARALEREDNIYLENGWKTLKILASPKSPSPALYFKKANDQAGYTAKSDLKPSQTGSHPQGRKFYLHHRNSNNWETKLNGNDFEKVKKQMMQVHPVKKGVSFLFHIDFDNLTTVELGALLYALNPTEKFQHKIGLGKPLGLGSIKIDIEGLFLINRAERYTLDGLFAQRYSEFRRNEKKSKEWGELYQRENSANSNNTEINIKFFVQEFRQKVNEIGNEDLLQALESIGNAKFDNVHYPKVLTKSDEQENFLWFVANDLPTDKKIRKMKIDNQDFQNTATKNFSLKPIINGKIELLEEIPLEEIVNDQRRRD